METEAHIQLKRLAAAYLIREGFGAVAMEVPGPIMRIRVDVAGYIDSTPVAPGFNHLTYAADAQAALPFDDAALRRPRVRCDPRIVVIECKQARADLVRDIDDLAKLLDLRDRLATRRASLEAAILADGDPGLRVHHHSLFSDAPECSTDPAGPEVGGELREGGMRPVTTPDGTHADFSRVHNHDYRRLLARIAKVEQKIHGQTKFFRLARYHAADRLYVLTFRDLARPRELPTGWGLLECDCRASDLRKKSLAELSEVRIRERAPAPDHATKSAWKHRWLRAIAMAQTRAWTKSAHP